MKRLVDYFIPHVHEGICMAFSGGVDSSVLLAAACKAVKKSGIDKPVLAVTFATRLHPHGDTAEAAEFAKMSGAVHKIIEIDEFSDARISENPRNRCYLCKSLLFQSLLQAGKEAGYTYFCEGSNLDDTKVYRPGIQAVRELNVASPLIECELTKDMIRSIAAAEGLSVASKPSTPCMATRLPYDTHFDYEAAGWDDYEMAFVLNWNTPHICSNNYGVLSIENNQVITKYYCYEHKDIITYDHDECNFGAWEKTNTTHTRTCHCTKEEKDLHTFNLNAKYCNVCNYYCNHTYAYQYLNTSLHYTTCSKCSYLKNSPHVFESSTSRYCIDCKRLIMDDGFGQIIGPLSATLVSLNGSYVLPSGNIVLVPEDKEAYYNGTLVFYNKNELPEVA